jgi:AraC-like DNA-binding protein
MVRAVSFDPFSDVLRLVKASSVISGGFAAGGTWAFRFPPPRQIVFSAIARGECWLRVEGVRKPVRVEEGDVGLLPGGKGFILGSSPTATPTDVVLANKNWGMDTIGDGSGCVVLAGRVSLDPSSAALLTDVLPDLVHVRAASPRATSLRWILREILDERTSTLPGSSIASAQLAQLLFTQILRAHLASSGTLPPGWLRAIGDERLIRALRLIHDEPGRRWRLSDLAKAAGMSRTRFVVHFSAIAGVAPLTYLAEWRMRLAQQRLREDDVTVAELAASLGYASESAFSNAFKRIIGLAPRKYRDATHAAVAPEAPANVVPVAPPG